MGDVIVSFRHSGYLGVYRGYECCRVELWEFKCRRGCCGLLRGPSSRFVVHLVCPPPTASRAV